MVNRFLIYSMTHNRPIRVMFLDTMKYSNITVIAFDETTVHYLKAGRKNPCSTEKNNILSAGYARGDRGDPLENALKEEGMHE